MNLLLSLTEQCNLRCSYCYYKKLHKNSQAVMNDDVMEAAICLAVEETVRDQIPGLCITFFGGEPTLYMDTIYKAVKFSKKIVKSRKSELAKGFVLDFAINTNATLLNQKIIDFFKKENFSIFLSLDGPAKQHNISRVTATGKGSFKLIEPHLAELAKMDTVVVSVITREHIKGLVKAVKWVHDMGFKGMSAAPDFDGEWSAEEMDALAGEYTKLANYWYDLKKKNDKFYIGTIQDKIAFNLLKLHCRDSSCTMIKDSFCVATNGNIFPCTRFVTSKPNAKFCIGNVFDNPDNIFGGEMAKKILKLMDTDKKKCKECAIKSRCHGNECGCTSFYTTGTLTKVSPEVCVHERILASICDDVTIKSYKKNGLNGLF